MQDYCWHVNIISGALLVVFQGSLLFYQCFDCNIMLLFTMFVKEKRYYQLFVQHTPLLYPDHVLSLLFDNETRAVRYDQIPI